MTAENLYVYALMRAEDPSGFDFPAVDAPDAEVRSLGCGPVQAVVSSIEDAEILSTRRNMLTHARALENLMEAGPILPMRFGLITTTPDQIRSTVVQHADRLRSMLDDLEGCVEMGVKISWDRARVMQEIVANQPDLAATYKALQGRDERETHYQRVELGRRVEAAMTSKRALEEAEYAKLLRSIARDAVIHEPDDELMALKADFLIHRDREPELQAALEAIEARDPERLTISYVGPAPVYNFVNLQLNWAAPPDAGQ